MGSNVGGYVVMSEYAIWFVIAKLVFHLCRRKYAVGVGPFVR